jgi:hypothetical protein
MSDETLEAIADRLLSAGFNRISPAMRRAWEIEWDDGCDLFSRNGLLVEPGSPSKIYAQMTGVLVATLPADAEVIISFVEDVEPQIDWFRLGFRDVDETICERSARSAVAAAKAATKERLRALEAWEPCAVQVGAV